MSPDEIEVGSDQQVGIEQMIREMCAAWTSHDAGKISSFFTDDSVYENVPRHQTYQGRAGVEGYVRVNFDAFPDVRFDVASVFAAGDRVALEWVMTGTHTGPLQDLPPTGKPFSLQGCSIIQLRDGRILRNTDYWDFMTFLHQLGVM